MKGENKKLNKNKTFPVVKAEDTFGIGDGFMISAIKIGKTTFIVSSYFENDKSFSDAMEPVIKHKIDAS
jgi:hypothetical protein